MRAERRREREQELKANNKRSVFHLIVSGLYIGALAAFLYFIFRLNVIPGKFLWPALAVIALISGLTLPSLISSKGKKGRKTVSSVICIILILCFGAGIYYLYSTDSFLSNITKRAEITEGFHVIVRMEDGLTEEERAAYFNMWKGCRRTLRRLGIKCSELEEMFESRKEKTA